MFRRPPTLQFAPELECCPKCSGELEVRKTRRTTLVTLDMGEMQVRETILYCPSCDRSYGSDELRRLKPPKGRFGYAVLVYVGKATFLRCRDGAIGFRCPGQRDAGDHFRGQRLATDRALPVLFADPDRVLDRALLGAVVGVAAVVLVFACAS